MSEPLVSQITSVLWHDARKEKPKCCGDRNCDECKRTYWLTEVTDND